MKASELMHGNIVLYEYEGQKFPARVVEIYRNSVLVESISGEYEPIEIDDGKIFPVEITTENLKKNGWECFNTYRKYSHSKAPFDLRQQKDGGYTIEIDSDEYGSATFLFILHVHQLQQALRLCGIDKEIEL